MVEKE
jgi:hypothetical protein